MLNMLWKYCHEHNIPVVLIIRGAVADRGLQCEKYREVCTDPQCTTLRQTTKKQEKEEEERKMKNKKGPRKGKREEE